MKAASVVLLLLGLFSSHVAAQSTAPHPGVVLFEQAKFTEAIRSLEIASKSKEHKSDAEIWNYLGLAYLAKDELKKSRKAFEKSVDLNPTSSVFRSNLAYAYLMNRQVDKAQKTAGKVIELDPRNAQAFQVRSTALAWEGKLDAAERDADSFIQLSPANADAYLLKSEILLAKLGIRVGTGNTVRDEVDFLKRALDTLTHGVAKAKGHPRYSELKSEFESIGVFYRHFSRDPVVTSATTPPGPEPGVTPLRILAKPRANYTDRARTAGVSGTVRVVAILGATGKIEHVLLVKRLGFGLDQQAITAAKKIKFEPKKIDGEPVSVVITIEYGFTIY